MRKIIISLTLLSWGAVQALAAPPSSLLFGPSSIAPCDIAAAAGTPCVAAHSVTRRMFSGYNGPLFQVQRASDSATANIGFGAGGIVNQAAITNFCAGTTCTYSLIYDQMHSGASNNNLPQATAANQAPVTYQTFANGATLPVLATVPTQFYRNRASTTGIPTGNASITEYMVVNTFTWSNCCGSYGDMEATVVDGGNGHMFAMSFTTDTSGTTTGNGPWPGVDWENGIYAYGSTPTTPLLTNLAKYNSGATTWTLKSDPGLTGTLGVLVNAAAPPDTADFEGGLSLGEGGDGSQAPTAFFEGIVIAAATTDATDNAIAVNIAAFYRGTPSLPVYIPAPVEAVQCGATAVTCVNTPEPTGSVPAGALLVVLTIDYSTDPTQDTLTDTQGNTYHLIAQQCNGYANGNAACPTAGVYSMFYVYNAKALVTGVDHVTMANPTATRLEFDSAYFTGMPTTDPLDAATVATNYPQATFPQAITSGPPAQGGELFVGMDGDNSETSRAPLGWNEPFTFKFINDYGNAGTIRNPPALPITWADGLITATGGTFCMIAGFKTY